MSNYSNESSKETFRFVDCSPLGSESDQDAYFVPIYKLLAVIYVFLSTTATLGNSLILVSLHKQSSLHLPSKLLLRSLAITDLCVGLIGNPLLIIFIFSAISERWAIVMNTILCGVSMMTMTAITVDRLLALLLRLRYRQIVTTKRVRAILILFWVVACLGGFLYTESKQLYFIGASVCNPLFILISTYSFTTIFRTIRRQQTQVQDTLGAGSGPNMALYKRTVSSALWVYLTFIACYFPLGVVTIVTSIHRESTPSLFLAQGLAFTLVNLNSSLNPIIYCWKIREVKQAVKETLAHWKLL